MAATLRSDRHAGRVKMVMLTSLASGNEAQLAYENGVDQYLTKPVRQHELLQALAKSLSRETQPAAAFAALLRKRFVQRFWSPKTTWSIRKSHARCCVTWAAKSVWPTTAARR